MYFQIHYQIGRAHGEAGFVHVEVHTNTIGHSLVTGTLGVKAFEERLRGALEDIARDIEKAVEKGALIE